MGKLWRADNLYSFLYWTNLFLYEYDKLKHSSIERSFHSSRSFFPPFPFSATFQEQKEVGYNPGCERTGDLGPAAENSLFVLPASAEADPRIQAHHCPSVGSQTQQLSRWSAGKRVAGASPWTTDCAAQYSASLGCVLCCAIPADLYRGCMQVLLLLWSLKLVGLCSIW